MRAPSVTVVIPCFNQGHFLADAVASVRAQEIEGGVELIVVDDGSTDETSALASRLGATLVRQSNRGLSSARNAGLAAAHGVFAVFLDADDELLPGSLAAGVAALGPRLDVDCLLRHCLLVDAAGRPMPTQPPEVSREDLYTELLHHNVTWAPGAAMFRRDAVAAAGGFPEWNSAAADYALYLRFAREHRLAYVHAAAACYRQHDANMSRDPLFMLRATLDVLDREERLVPRALRRDWTAGRRAWCDFYGDQIVDEMRRAWRGRTETIAVVRALATLLRHCPSVAAKHARRKLFRVARGLPSGHLDPPTRLSPASGRPRNAGR
jgi:glycosyltransferase involved in cell wall biosynthesis